LALGPDLADPAQGKRGIGRRISVNPEPALFREGLPHQMIEKQAKYANAPR
jgi:hypothetical protein